MTIPATGCEFDAASMTELNMRVLAAVGAPGPDASRMRSLFPKAVGLSLSYTKAEAFEGWSIGITFHPWAAGW